MYLAGVLSRPINAGETFCNLWMDSAIQVLSIIFMIRTGPIKCLLLESKPLPVLNPAVPVRSQKHKDQAAQLHFQ